MKSFKEYLQEGINDKGIFKAVFLSGIPGSGKSYTINKISDGTFEPRIVNTDKMVEFIDPDNGKEFNRIILDKSKVLTKSQLLLFIDSMLPLVIDGTSSNAGNLIQRMAALESIGYDIAMVWVNTDVETAIKRAAARERNVDADFIKRVNDKSGENKSFFKSKFSTFLEIDNNDGELTNKVITAAGKKMTSFFGSPIKNPIGKRNKQKLIDTKEKFLIPSIFDKSTIAKKINVWYKK